MRSRSAASFSYATRSSRACSDRPCGSRSAHCWRPRSSPPANGRAGPSGSPASPACPTAHIPSILTAAGTTVAYADVYAGHALYGFLAPGSAFILLALVALATLAAALLHGPALAGLGLVGAYVTPLLVASQRPDYWSLYVYLAVVTAAAFALARFRMWRWLAITAVAFSAVWSLAGMGAIGANALGAHAFYVIACFVLAASLIVAGLWLGPDALPGRIDGVSSAALGAYLVVATLLVIMSRHDPLALATFAALAAATVAIAWRAEAATAAVPAAAVLVVLVFARWAADSQYRASAHAVRSDRRCRCQNRRSTNVGLHLMLGTAFALLFGGAGYLAQGRSERAARACPVERGSGVRADRDSCCALLPHRPVRAFDSVSRRPRCC